MLFRKKQGVASEDVNMISKMVIALVKIIKKMHSHL